MLLFVWSHLVRKRCRACTTNLLAKKNGQLVKCTPLSLSMYLSMQLSSRSNQWPGQDGPRSANWAAPRAAKQDETMQRKENLLSAYILFSLRLYIFFYHSACFPFSLFSSISLYFTFSLSLSMFSPGLRGSKLIECEASFLSLML